MKQTGIILILFILFFSLPSKAMGKNFVQIQKQEPSLAEILKAFYQQQQLNGHSLKKLKKKARMAPLLPTLTVGYDHVLRQSQGLGVADNVSISSGAVTIGPQENDYDFDSYLGSTIRVRASWRLDELILSRYDLAFLKENRDLARLRTDLAQRISKVYHERYQFLLKYLVSRKSSRKKSEVFYGQYLIWTQKLDGLTGGQFRKTWWKR